MKSIHRQCTLQRGNEIFHSWLPDRFAVVGKTLDFDEEGDGWKVTSVAGEISSEWIRDRKSNVFASIKK